MHKLRYHFSGRTTNIDRSTMAESQESLDSAAIGCNRIAGKAEHLAASNPTSCIRMR
jgi:hypothetical protein